MNNTFRTYPNRLDARLVCFKANDADQAESMAREIRCNSTTGYVKAGPSSVSVPAHAAAAVSGHLVKNGWIAA